MERAYCADSRPQYTSSSAPIAARRDVSLMMTANLFPSEGRGTRNVGGRGTGRIARHRVRPIASAASTCPLGTDWKPARKISAWYADVWTARARTAYVSPAEGSRDLRTKGSQKNANRIITSAGGPRTMSTYTEAGHARMGWRGRRAHPTKKPQ